VRLEGSRGWDEVCPDIRDDVFVVVWPSTGGGGRRGGPRVGEASVKHVLDVASIACMVPERTGEGEIKGASSSKAEIGTR
jgi:hypothetical protein